MILLYNLALLISLAHAYRYLSQQVTRSNPCGSKSKPQAKISLVPYHALVFYSKWFCSGTLIGSKIVLTTASCLFEPDANISVKFGVDSIIDDGQTIPVAETKIHEFFKHLNQLDNDIALLILERHVEFARAVRKIVIAEADVALRPASSFVATGWGSSHKGQHRVKRLMWAPFVLQNNYDCHRAYGLFVTSSMFCGRYSLSYRLSDNGGAAVYGNRFMVGIVSYTSTNNPTVAIFTNVSYFHRWIKINTIKLLQKHCTIEEIANSDYEDYTIPSN